MRRRGVAEQLVDLGRGEAREGRRVIAEEDVRAAARRVQRLVCDTPAGASRHTPEGGGGRGRRQGVSFWPSTLQYSDERT